MDKTMCSENPSSGGYVVPSTPHIWTQQCSWI